MKGLGFRVMNAMNEKAMQALVECNEGFRVEGYECNE
jgi:hypothetical protein